MGKPRTIAVDLIPVLPGAENGGAKIFTIALIKALAETHPDTRFILLTRGSSHDELEILDRRNVSRLLVWSIPKTPSIRQKLLAAGRAAIRSLPSPLTGWLRSARDLLTAKAAPPLLRSIGADLLFCPFTAPHYHDLEVPTVCVLYDLQYKTYPQFFCDEELAQRERTFTNATRCASALAVTSDYVRRSVIKTGAIAADRVFTVHIRLPERLLDSKNSPAVDPLARLGISRFEYLLYPANFWRHKNHELLLTAFVMARAGGLPQHINLVFTGAPSERVNELGVAVEALGLKEHVVFAGFLSDSEFAAVMSECLAVVFPSLYEGFGMPVVEAMAAGRPVACSDKTSLPEVAGDAALLFDPRIPSQLAQAIIRIATDDDLRRGLIERGHERAASFGNPAQMANEYWRVFESVLANAAHVEEIYDDDLSAAPGHVRWQGIYEDGWSGPTISLRYSRGRPNRSIDLELHAPAWLPIKRFTAIVRAENGRAEICRTISAGDSPVLQVPFGTASGKLEIRITPSFQPCDVIGNGDPRELMLLVRRLQLCSGDSSITLFPPTPE